MTWVGSRERLRKTIFAENSGALIEIFYLVRYGTLDVEDDRIGECAFDLSAYHL